VNVESNSDIFARLVADATIRLRPGKLFSEPVKPLSLNFDKIEGMLLGLAVGDALGNTSEGMLPRSRRAVYGEIRDYLPNRHAGERAVGLPSDDTQMAFWTLEQLLLDGGLVPDNLAERFCRDRIFGIGGTVRQFIAAYTHGTPWHQAGPGSAGNGALMRIAPMCLDQLYDNADELWFDTALAAMLTHNDNCSIASCLALVRMLRGLLAMTTSPARDWWLDTWTETTHDLEDNTRYSPRGGRFTDFRGSAGEYVRQVVGDALAADLPVQEACNAWYSGAYLLETVPSVLYILSRHGHDPEEAIIRAVNDTKDNDTIAAIVGAAVGALHGKASLPARWIENLTGRTTYDDDGRIFELMEKLKK
jgi:ADP-ribosylglycohydrolase